MHVHKPLRIALIVVGVLIVVVLALPPFLISGDQFRPRLQTELTQKLGRDVQIGSLRLSILSGGLAANEITIAEDPAFGKEPFLRAKTLRVGVELIPLIFSHQVNVRSLTIDQPQVNLVRSGTKWNASTLGQAGPRRSKQAADFSIGKLAIEDGRITIRDARSGDQPTIYENVSFRATDLAPAKPFPFALSAIAPSGGKINVEGSAGPLAQSDSAQTPLSAKFTLDSFDVARTGMTGSDSGMAGVVNLNGTLKSDGRTAHIEAKGKADRLQLVRGGAPSKVPVQLDTNPDYDLQRQTATITRGLVNIGAATARLTGTYNGAGKTSLLDMRLQGHDMPLNDLQRLLPAIGVMLPTGSSLQGGTATADLGLAGPIDRLVTSGSVNLANTRLAGFDLGSKLSAIGKLSGAASKPDTTIQTLSANLRISPEGIRADNINLIVPALGTTTGSGVIAPNNTLNFRMVANLDSSASLVGAVTQIAGLGQRSARLPFIIQGTTANPVFVPDVAGLAGSNLNPLGQQNAQPTANPVGDILGGFFGKKK